MSALATLQQLADRTGVQFDPADIQSLRALQDASALVRAYKGRDYADVTDEDITLNGSGTRALVLPDYPVTDVTDVLILADDESITAVDTTGWRLLGDEGILVRKSGDGGWPPIWPAGYANIALTYSHGYETPPDNIVAATCLIASRLRATAAAGGSLGVVTSETIGSYSVTRDPSAGTVDETTGLTADEKALLGASPLVLA